MLLNYEGCKKSGLLKLIAEKKNWDNFIWRLLLLVLGTADGANTGSEINDAWAWGSKFQLGGCYCDSLVISFSFSLLSCFYVDFKTFDQLLKASRESGRPLATETLTRFTS